MSYRVVASPVTGSWNYTVVRVPVTGECTQVADCGSGSSSATTAAFVAAALNAADTDGNGVVDP